jgi:hypothetical protein
MPCFHQTSPDIVKKTLCSRSGNIRPGAPPPTGKTPTYNRRNTGETYN